MLLLEYNIISSNMANRNVVSDFVVSLSPYFYAMQCLELVTVFSLKIHHPKCPEDLIILWSLQSEREKWPSVTNI